MTDFIETIRNATGGYAPDQVIPDRFVRFPTSKKYGDLSGWAMKFADGKGGVFGCFRSGIFQTWQARQPRTEGERRRWVETIRKNQERTLRELAEQRAECRQKSAELWGLARDISSDTQHPYTVSKRISPYGARQLNNSLLIPVRGNDGTLRGLLFIDPTGGKRFKVGTEIIGSYLIVGSPKDQTLLCCEGWATGCSLHESTGHAVAVAFTAGNLNPVAEILRNKHPDWRLIICADDDHATERNPGLTKATEAARAVSGLLAIPDFVGTRRSVKDTDFNDLYRLSGPAAVRLCIERAEA